MLRIYRSLSSREDGSGLLGPAVRGSLLLLLLAAVAVLVMATLHGVVLGVHGTRLAAIVALFGSLALVARRHARPGGDERVALMAAALTVLFVGGALGGVTSIVGQTLDRPFVDAPLNGADLSLGIDLLALNRALVAAPGTASLLGVAYLSSFPLIGLTALLLAWRRDKARLQELCAVFCLTMLAATAASVAWPAVGPFRHLAFPADFTADLPPGSGTYHLVILFHLREAERFSIDPLQLSGVVTFPSFHVMMALLTAAAWRDRPRWFAAMVAWQAVVIVSTLPIGGHYLVDLPAGASCWFAAHRAVARWSRAPEPPPAPDLLAGTAIRA